MIEGPRLLTEAVDVEGGGRLVSLFYIRGSFSPEQIELHEGAGVGVHSLDELDDLMSLRSYAELSAHTSRP